MREYEKVTVFGLPALYTNERINDDDVADGLHVYHVREGDEGRFCTIEKKVLVNHAGSIVTALELKIPENGYLPLEDENNHINFLGEKATEDDLLKEAHDFVPVWPKMIY